MNTYPKALGGVAAGVRWVRGELEHNLRQAIQLIEQHSDVRDDPAPLNLALSHLQEARGVAVMVQAYGVALLAEEVTQTLAELAAGRVREADAAYTTLVSACLQAVDYLDLLEHGHDDCALVLQPIVNELRLVRGKGVLTEDDLFVAQFRVLGLSLARSSMPGAGEVQVEAARLTPVFSAALLSWFKQQDTAKSLSRIGRIAEVLSDLFRNPPLYQLWRTAAACVEALLSGTLDPTLELKRQFGRAGQLLKVLAESGEGVAEKQMSDVSLRLLFYAGRSRGAGQRVAFLRQSLQLETWLPPVDVIQARRAQLRGASTGLLAKVVEELRADLAEVRDHIDVALRSGADEQEFQTTAQTLKRVADTLLMLGLTAESQALAEPVETLQETARITPASASEWMEFATAVLQVDLSLESALYRQLQAPTQAVVADKITLTADLREGVAALLRESLVNLQQIKTQVETWIEAGDGAGLHESARLLDEVAAGLSIMGLAPAAQLVHRVRRFVQSAEFSGVRSVAATAQGFADALAAIEYFLEFRREGSPAAQPVLDRLAAIVAALPEVPQIDAPASATLSALDVPQPMERVAAADDDAEIRGVFVDEAGEVLSTLREALPRWLHQPADREILTVIRRGFHTLKGSGRMVRADEIAELAWAFEQLLNRCLDGSVEISGAVIEVVRQALDLLPGMVEAFARRETALQVAIAIAERARIVGADSPSPGAPRHPLPAGEGSSSPLPEAEAIQGMGVTLS
ncbi:MAG: Hpt domain-containing protein, partial [Panacagrimonas sp.]